MMKRPRMEMTDMPFDIVRDIVIRVAKSSDGAADMARLISTCMTMYDFVEDIDVLRAVCFDRLMVSVHLRSLQKYESLVTRCAAIGHPKALCFLAKVILMTTSQILINIVRGSPEDVGSMTYIRALFQDTLGDEGHPVDGSELHIKAVKFFLHMSSPIELSNMRIQLLIHLQHFVMFPVRGNEEFYRSIDSICRSVHWETLYYQLEHKGRDILSMLESRSGRTPEPWKPKTELNELFFSMQNRVEILAELWGSFQRYVPGLHETTQLRSDERVLRLCYCFYSAFIEDFKIIAINLDYHRITAIAALDDAFPLLGT